MSGERPAVEAGAELAKALGAKRAIVLPVSVAAHSPLMAEAAEGMRTALADVTFQDPDIPLLANADARDITTAATAGPSSSSTSPPASIGSGRSSACRQRASRRSSRSVRARS